jgi:hypothetical protein
MGSPGPQILNRKESLTQKVTGAPPHHHHQEAAKNYAGLAGAALRRNAWPPPASGYYQGQVSPLEPQIVLL